MKQILFKILKVFFIIAVILLTILLVFGIVLSFDWAWWVGLFILLPISSLAALALVD